MFILAILIGCAFMWHVLHVSKSPDELGSRGAAWSVRVGVAFSALAVTLLSWALFRFAFAPVDPNVEDPAHLVRLAGNIQYLSLVFGVIRYACGLALALYSIQILENSRFAKRLFEHPLSKAVVLMGLVVAAILALSLK